MSGAAGAPARGPARTIGLTFIAAAAVARILIVLHRVLDPDESQHLHAAWRVAQGLVPHRDFWEHHLALFYYLLAPVTRLFEESPAVFTGARVLMVLFGAASLALTYGLGRRLGPGVGPLALAVLLTSPEFTDLSTETRPDVPALVAWLLGLQALVRWRGTDRWGWLVAAGLAQGTMVALTTKALFALPGVLVVLAVGAARQAPAGSPRWLGRVVAAGALFGAAMLAVPALLLGALAMTGGLAALAALVDQVVLDNLAFVDFAKNGPVGDASVAVLVAGILGVMAVAQVRRWGLLTDRVHGTLLPPAVSLAVVLSLPGVPAVYAHAWLPILPILALYASVAGVGLLAWAYRRPGRWRRLAVAAVGALVLVVPAVTTVVHLVLPDHGGPQRALVRRLLTRACPGEPVLDGNALAVYRPSAHRHGVLILGVREWVARGVMAEEEVEADIRQARAPVAVPDRRLRALVGPVAKFLARHYVALDREILVLGGEARADGGPGGGRAYVDLLRGGRYRLEVAPGVALAINHVPADPGWRDMEAGRHEMTWTGGPGAIRLTIGDCAERGGPGRIPAG